MSRDLENTPITKAFPGAVLIRIDRIEPNPNQPRQSMDPQGLEDLTVSIAEDGVLQPLVVRPGNNGKFVIVVGGRRYAACELIGKRYVPCIIRDISERRAAEQALVENIQREDLNPVEEGLYIRWLMNEFGHSYRNVAAKTSKSIGYVHSRTALIEYEDVARAVLEDRIGIFDARELVKIAKEGIRENLIEKVAAGKMTRHALKQAVKRATAVPSEAEANSLQRGNPWSDPEYAPRVLLGRSLKEPSGLEKDFAAYAPPRLKYVGGGQLWIALTNGSNKNPDFVVKPFPLFGVPRIAIELFGERFHQGEDPQELIDEYAKIGITCFVIWGRDFYKDPEGVVEDVLQDIEALEESST